MTCLRAPAGWFCTRKAGHFGACALVKQAAAVLPADDRQTVHMGRTLCPPAIATTDPRLLTCCLAIDEGTGRVCHDTKGHENPLHEWARPTPPARRRTDAA
jgi:hypothetical protein